LAGKNECLCGRVYARDKVFRLLARVSVDVSPYALERQSPAHLAASRYWLGKRVSQLTELEPLSVPAGYPAARRPEKERAHLPRHGRLPNQTLTPHTPPKEKTANPVASRSRFLHSAAGTMHTKWHILAHCKLPRDKTQEGIVKNKDLIKIHGF